MIASVLCAVALVGATPSVEAQGRDLREVTREIAKQRDKADPALFDELVAIGGLDALQAVEDALAKLKRAETRAQLLAAAGGFATSSDAAVVEGATALLAAAALRGDGPAPRAAAESLVGFGDAALDALERVARDAESNAVRGVACDPLVPFLAKRGDLDALALIVAAAVPRYDPELVYLGLSAREAEANAARTHHEVVRRAVATCRTPERRALLIEKLRAEDTSRAWRLLLCDTLAGIEGEDVDAALRATLDDADAAVTLEALAAVRARGGAWEELEPHLRPLMTHPEIAVRRAAVVQMGWLGATDEAWRAEAIALARSADASLRMGAASALAEIRTPEAIEALHALLADKLWSVRVEALEQVARLRRLESVPVLIERLGREEGRFRDDAHAALRMLTGLDHGSTPERWSRWWEAEGAAFELPSHAAAVQAERERRERAAAGDSRATHYFGANVASERVVFVLDISGSMRLPSGDAPGDAGDVELTQTTRMDVAKRELAAVVRNLPDGTLFNIVFFESLVASFEKKLVRMQKSTRQRALRFVAEQYAVGSTALYPALELAFEDPLVDTIYLLSDGAPTEGAITDIAEIRAEVRRWNSARHVRIHGIAMGQDSTLLRWLTEDTGGRYVRVD